MATSYQEQTSGTLPEWNTQVMDLLKECNAKLTEITGWES